MIKKSLLSILLGTGIFLGSENFSHADYNPGRAGYSARQSYFSNPIPYFNGESLERENLAKANQKSDMDVSGFFPFLVISSLLALYLMSRADWKERKRK